MSSSLLPSLNKCFEGSLFSNWAKFRSLFINITQLCSSLQQQQDGGGSGFGWSEKSRELVVASRLPAFSRLLFVFNRPLLPGMTFDEKSRFLSTTINTLLDGEVIFYPLKVSAGYRFHFFLEVSAFFVWFTTGCCWFISNIIFVLKLDEWSSDELGHILVLSFWDSNKH